MALTEWTVSRTGVGEGQGFWTLPPPLPLSFPPSLSACESEKLKVLKTLDFGVNFESVFADVLFCRWLKKIWINRTGGKNESLLLQWWNIGCSDPGSSERVRSPALTLLHRSPCVCHCLSSPPPPEKDEESEGEWIQVFYFLVQKILLSIKI